MKLRIFKQSLRFRLTPEDMEILRRNKNIGDKLSLTPQTEWTYGINLKSTALPQIHSEDKTHLSIDVPDKAFLLWMDSKEIEWTYQQEKPVLKIFIEKDLKPHRP